MRYILLLGTAGIILLFLAFLIIQRRKNIVYFNMLNMIASLLLGIYAFSIGNIVFLFIEIMWIIASLVFLAK